ncbi:MAG: ankyrin repeat domain-containing protein [Planctomycetia bacterium]|nr:ankyrin repeat domain-containing protein [Planctomycetia bacterium]
MQRRWFFIAPVVVIGIAIRFAWPDPNTLTHAAARGDVDTVRLCLWLGVDPNTPKKWGWHHADGQTPLTAAAEQGRVEVVRILLRSGADLNLRDAGPEYPHVTPVATTAMHGQLEVCRILLEAGADPNVPTYPKQPGAPGEWTALDWALQANHLALADLLRQHGGRESGRRIADARAVGT